jgi:hypothetical protein
LEPFAGTDRWYLVGAIVGFYFGFYIERLIELSNDPLLVL